MNSSTQTPPSPKDVLPGDKVKGDCQMCKIQFPDKRRKVEWECGHCEMPLCDDCSCTCEDSQEPREYFPYNVEYVVKIMVSGGGLGNGNAYANIEGAFINLDNYKNGEDPHDGWWYVEYGRNPSSHLIGDELVWTDEGGFEINGVDWKLRLD